MSNATTDVTSPADPDSPSKRCRNAERFLFAGTIVAGVAGAGSTIGGLSLRIGGSLLAGAFLLGSVFVVPGLVYLDASRIRSRELDWEPRPVLYAAATFVLTPVAATIFELARMPLSSAMQPLSLFYYDLVAAPPRMHSMLLAIAAPLGALFYLARRYEHLDGASASRHWWALLPAVVAGAVAYLAAELLVPGSLRFVAAVVMLLASLFPIAAFMDSLYLRNREWGWTPNPAVQFLLAYASILVFPISVLYPVYAAYHLGRRWRGRPS